MTYLILKAVLSGVIVMVVSEVARRSPGLGALIVSLPLISVLAMMDRKGPCRGHLLAGAAHLADVPGPALAAAARLGVLALARLRRRADDGTVCRHCVAAAAPRH